MTMAALLSHFGIADRRFVTAEGLVLFDGVSGSSSFGFTHPAHGTVTPMPRHTFHGEVEEPSGSSGSRWWDEAGEVERHESNVRAAFPRFARSDREGRPPVWTGAIDTGRGRFVIEVATREDRGLPFVRVLGGPPLGMARAGRWVRAPHLYLNGNLCVADQSDWDEGTDTVATAILWAAHWLAAYTEWRIINRWPVEGSHADVA